MGHEKKRKMSNIYLEDGYKRGRERKNKQIQAKGKIPNGDERGEMWSRINVV